MWRSSSRYENPSYVSLLSQTLLSLFTHTQQVEDTLNNSNELFLTFRKEMEEMSKKTKRLEKENLTLTRKHDQTNRNILEMAEERTRDKDELEKLHKKETQMRSIIQSMREQGRGTSQDVPPEVDDEGTESDYEDEYEDEEDEEGSFEGEEDLAAELSKPVFGPVPPPTLSEAKPNGSKASVNGIKH
jgi:chromosome segregation ATPase